MKSTSYLHACGSQKCVAWALLALFLSLTTAAHANQTAFGSGFLERQERLVTGDNVSLPLPDYTLREWKDNLTSWRLRLRGVSPSQVWVQGPNGQPVASQCDPGVIFQNGDREARLLFFATQPASGTVAYTLRVGSPPAVAGTSPSVAPTANGRHLELGNGVWAVRLPPSGKVTYPAALPLGRVPLPVQSVRLRDGSWVGQSSVVGSKRQVLGLEIQKTVEGPMLAEVLMRYRLAPATPGGPEGYWTLALRAYRGLPMLAIEEELDTGIVTEETPDIWRLDLDGWQFDSIRAGLYQGSWRELDPYRLEVPESVKGQYPPFNAFGDRYEGPSMVDAPLNAPMVSRVAGLPAFLDWGDGFFWAGVYQTNQPDSNFVGVFPMHGGAWRRWPKVLPSFIPGKGVRLDIHVGINTPAEPVYSLSTAGDDVNLSRTTGRRQWALCLGAPLSAYELGVMRCRYGSLSLDEIKEWQVEWPGMEDLTAATYPRLYSTPELAAITRQQYAAGTLPAGDRAAISGFGCYTGSWDRGKLFHVLGGHRDTFDNSPNVWGHEPGIFWPMPTYRTGQNWTGGQLPHVDDNLSDPSLPASQRHFLLKRLAMYAHLYSSPEFAPIASGVHQGNPNMPLNRGVALPAFVALIPNHPKAAIWRDLAFDYYQNIARTYASAGGSWREASASYEAASVPFLQYAALALNRLGRSFDLNGLYDNAVNYAIGTTSPTVARYGARIREPFGNSGIVTQGGPLVTALILAANGDMPRARRAVAAYDAVDGTIPNYHTDVANRMLVGALAGIRAGGPVSVDRGSKIIAGFGASLRGRPGTPQESFLLLRGGYNASHMDGAEQGAFAFHTAGDELIGWPDNGYLRQQTTWDQADAGSAWSSLGSAGAAGEFNDVGFTPLADYAAMAGGRQRRGFATGWTRQTVLVKGERSDEYDYVVFRDLAAGAGFVQNIHLATRLPATNWTPVAGGVDLTGRFGGFARMRVLQPATSEVPLPAKGITYPHSDNPMSWLRNAFLGTLDGRPESAARIAKAETAKGRINVGDTDPNASFIAHHSSLDVPVGNVKNATWILLGQTNPANYPSATALADGVVQVVFPNGDTDYVFLRHQAFTFSNPDLSFSGRAGVIRVRGTAVKLSINVGYGNISYRGVGLAGTGPIHRSATLADTNTQTIIPPPSGITYTRITGVETTLAPGVTKITDAANQRVQYIVESLNGLPIQFDQPGAPDSQRLTVDGITSGAITVDPLGADIVVVNGSGLFNAQGYLAIGSGPFKLRRNQNTLTGQSDGPARIIQTDVEGFGYFLYYKMNGGEFALEKTGGIWLANLPVAEGPSNFSVESYEGRARVLPSHQYSLDRLPVRELPSAIDPEGAVFTGQTYWNSPSAWSTGVVPPAGATVTLPASAELLVSSATPRWGHIRVAGAIRFVGTSGVLQADQLDLWGRITHSEQFTTLPDAEGVWAIDNKVTIRANRVIIHSSGHIDANGKGYGDSGFADGRGAGPGVGNLVASDPTGASHGGLGGRGNFRATAPGAIVGDKTSPVHPGSGTRGARGGGVIDLEATGLLTIDGTISANALVPPSIEQVGGAAGGSVWLRAAAVSGNGLVSADGGNASHADQVPGPAGGGGGGGRIAVAWSNETLQSEQDPAVEFSVSGGRGRFPGEPGTLHLTDASFFPKPHPQHDFRVSVAKGGFRRSNLVLNGTRVVGFEDMPVIISGPILADGSAQLSFIRSDVRASSLVVQGDARVAFEAAGKINAANWSQFVIIDGPLQLANRARLHTRTEPTTGAATWIKAAALHVAPDAALDSDLGGYPGVAGRNGRGPGAGLFYNDGGRGAGHGGNGGRTRDTAAAGGAPYGDAEAPDLPGSSGGGDDSSYNGVNRGGDGGGVVRLTVSGLAKVEGRISADGGHSPGVHIGTLAYANTGGGSGGSVWLTTHTLQGNGVIRARGGEGNPNGGAGGGGRILIESVANAWTGSALTPPVSTPFGAIGQSGFAQNGTVVLRTVADTSPPTDLVAPAYEAIVGRLSGSVSSPGLLRIFDDQTEIARLQLATAGPWQHVFSPPLAPGLRRLSYWFLADGQTALTISAPAFVEIATPANADRSPPATPVAPTLLDELPTRLLISGATEPDASVRIYVNGVLRGQSSTTPLGTWTYSIQEPRNPIGYRVHIIAIDTAGNASAPSPDAFLPGEAPVFSPLSGTYYAPHTVTLSAPESSVIRYTLDGTDPSQTNGQTYTGPIPLATGEHELRAIAIGVGLSPVSRATYTVLAPPLVAAPLLSPAPGTYEAGQLLTLTSPTPGARIRYTFNGSVPTSSSPDIASGGTISPPNGLIALRAVAHRPGFSDSGITTGSYTLLPPGSDWSLFSHLTGPFGDNNDGTSYELGAKFRVTKPGRVTAIRYYRAPSETGSHIGRLWRVTGSSTGTQLASVAFSAANDASGAGWREQPLPSPITLLPGETYLVSVNINTRYVLIEGGLAEPQTRGPLATPGAINGFFGTSGQYPTGHYKNSNYLRDVAFQAFTPLEAWRHAMFGTDAVNSQTASASDPDGDGFNNFLEYAHGSLPLVGNPNGTPVLGMDEGHLTLTYSKNKSATDLTFLAEVSSNLVNWSSAPIDVQQIWQLLDGETIQRITARDQTPINQATNRFLRLKVIQP